MATALVLIYAVMLVFDAAVLFGTAYLVAERAWSAWWMLAAVIVCTGSSPRKIIGEWRDRAPAQPSTDTGAPHA